MHAGYEEREIPTGGDAVDRWGSLDNATRFGLVFGTRTPESRPEALTAMGFAREMRQLGAVYLMLLAAGVTAAWVALALLTDSFTPLGLIPAFGFAFGFGWLGRIIVARSLEKRARRTLDPS